MATSRVVGRTIVRAILVCGFLSMINEVAGNVPVVRLCNILLPIWAVSHLFEAAGRLTLWAFHQTRQVRRQRRMRREVIAKEVEPVSLHHWNLHD
jgi:hypothetical protein